MLLPASNNIILKNKVICGKKERAKIILIKLLSLDAERQ